MGEYALRISDKQEVKIGTCENMYYLRFEDRCKVQKIPNSLNPQTEPNLYWRLPFADEDKNLPGNYEQFDRAENLPLASYPETAETVGNMHISKMGLHFNIPCHHGEKVPEIPGMAFGWNGKEGFWELESVKNTAEGKVLPVVKCKGCGKSWVADWNEVLPFVCDSELTVRFEKYAALPIEGGVQS